MNFVQNSFITCVKCWDFWSQLVDENHKTEIILTLLGIFSCFEKFAFLLESRACACGPKEITLNISLAELCNKMETMCHRSLTQLINTDLLNVPNRLSGISPPRCNSQRSVMPLIIRPIIPSKLLRTFIQTL